MIEDKIDFEFKEGDIMNNKELMEAINNQWCDNEEHMGEQAALHVACEQYGKSVDWFYDHVGLIAIKPEQAEEQIN